MPTARSRRRSHDHFTPQVVKNNWYGFLSWIGKMDGVVWKDCEEYDGVTTYDLVSARVTRGGGREGAAAGGRAGAGAAVDAGAAAAALEQARSFAFGHWPAGPSSGARVVRAHVAGRRGAALGAPPQTPARRARLARRAPPRAPRCGG